MGSKSPTILPRHNPESWVLGDKLYATNSFHGFSFSHPPPRYGGEVYDLVIDKWEIVPNPPIYPSYFPKNIIISAALKNPGRIIVAYRAPDDYSSAIFYAYNVQNRYWSMLALGKRKLHRLCADDCTDDYWLQDAASVNNTLYWMDRSDDSHGLMMIYGSLHMIWI